MKLSKCVVSAVLILCVGAAALADHDIDVPYVAAEGTAVIDGDLSDWAGATWIPLDAEYSGVAADVTAAQYALRWSPTTNMIYVAASVTDTSQHFENTWVSWNTQDDIELYLDAGENNISADTTPNNYGTYQDYAQQLAVGYHADGTWANFGWMLGDDLNLCPEYAAALNGDTITYEAAFTPYSYYTGFGGADDVDTIVTLVGGQTIGFDVVVGAYDNGAFNMVSNNLTGGKFKYSAAMQTWELAGGSAVKPGDADLDGDVDLDDFVALKVNFGSGTTWAQGDFDEDGDVDLDDFVILKTNFGS